MRFLALLLGLWIGMRAVIITMPDAPAPAHATAARPRPTPVPPVPPASPASPAPAAPAAANSGPSSNCCLIRELSYKTATDLPGAPAFFARVRGLLEPMPDSPRSSARRTNPPLALHPADSESPRPAAAWSGAPAPARPAGSRWSGSAWLLVREGRGQAALAPGGTLGGSQAGARLLYRVGGGFSLSGRAYAPLRRSEGAEAAAAIDWQPLALVPVHLLVERRQDAGGAGRSAFALTLYGGASGRLPGGLRGEAYAQAGVVGTRSRDLFVDATARVGVPVGRVEAGASAWGAAQPGAARLDVGPHVYYRLPVGGAKLRVQADWRFRIAGDAAPGSGPALTLAADF